MIDRLGSHKCTGCFACVQKCPKNCIAVMADDEGFWAPVVDKEQCVRCGLCEKACPQLTPQPLHEPIAAYAARIKDDDLLKKSTSGGVFALAARTILRDGGVVFGVAMDEKGIVEMVAIEDECDLHRLQGSKYVQANVGDAYVQAKRFLNAGREVLFSGTPCQIAGLYGYLGKEYDHLYTLDVVCHGVPSQELFSKYRSWLEKKFKKPILKWYFRDKKRDGWAQIDRLELQGKTIYQRENLDPYTYTYLKSLNLRESCYECQFATAERCSDMTAGDYWGLRNHHPEFYSDKGVCLLVTNTQNGEKLLKRMHDDILLLKSEYAIMRKYNEGLVCKPTRPQLRDSFYREFRRKPMDQFVKEHMKVPFNVKEHLRKFVPHSLRLKVKDTFRKLIRK